MRTKSILVVMMVMILMGTILVVLPRIFAEEPANKNTYYFIFKINTLASLKDANEQTALSNSAIESLKEKSDVLGIDKVHMEVKEKDIVILTHVTEMEPKKILEVIQPDKLSTPLTLIAIFKGERITP